MNRCTNPELEKMLHHYELGLLADEDRRRVEIHLMECEHCFTQVQQFQEAARLMRSSPSVRERIKQIAVDQERRATERIRPPLRRRPWSALVPSGLIAVVVLLVLVLTDWRIYFRRSDEAVAVENRLVVMPFVNLASDDDSLHLSAIAANLLITDLSESQYVQVASSQRLRDILNTIGWRESDSITGDVMSVVAQRARARWSLAATILQTSPHLVVSSQLVDEVTGTVIASQRVEGTAGENIFAIIDELSVQVKEDLPLPGAAVAEQDRDIADVTTHSQDAYRNYLEGVELFQKYYFAEAKAHFERTVAVDSTFAMAYYYLARLADKDERGALIDRAAELAGDATQKDRLWIEGRQALYVGDYQSYEARLKDILERHPDEKEALYDLGTYEFGMGRSEAAIEYFQRAIQLDPFHKLVYNQLAYAYSRLGKVDSALWAADRYVELAPDEANPYDSRADICVAHGLIDEAKISYRKALEAKPDFAHSLLALGDLCLLTQEYTAADSCYRKLAVDSPDPQERSLARYYLALIPLMQGKLTEAIRLLNDCIASDRVDDIEDEQVYKYRLRGLIQYDQRHFVQALASIDTAYQITLRVDAPGREVLRSYQAKILVAAGRVREAEEIVAELEPIPEGNGDSSLVYLYAAGALALNRGNAQTAIELLRKAATIRECFPPHYLLAQAYLLAGRCTEAAELLEDQLKVYSSWHVSAGHWHVKMHYLLALAYEGLEKYQHAIEEYETFLEIWVGADEEIPELDAARRSLKRLKQSP